MRRTVTTTLGTLLLGISLHASAALVDITGTAQATGFAERPSGFTGTPVPGPFDPLSAQFTLSYDALLAPVDGSLAVALDSLSLGIGGVTFDAFDASAELLFSGGALIGLLVGADANGVNTLVPETNDFLFSNIAGVQVFQYTASGQPGVLTGLFETLFTPGADPDIGEVAVTFMPVQAVSTPPALLLVLCGAGVLLAGRRRRTAAPAVQ